MRIALVTETFYPAVDGTTTTVKAVADRLIDTGHEVRIIAPGPGLACYRRSDVVRLRPLDKPGGQVRDALASYGPDLVHVTSPGTVGRKALKHAARLGIPTVVVQQAPVPELVADYWRLKVADRAGRVLVTAPWMVDRVADLGVEATLWEPGVDIDAFTPALRDGWLQGSWSRARSKEGPLVTVGYVGSLHRRHGVRRLPELNAVPGIRPVIIGDGPQREWLRAKMPRAKMTGTLPTGDLTVAMATLDLLVHPGVEETCCHALREAGASGVPIVAPRAGGARDVVRPLETGLLYDAADPHGLTRAVAAVVADRQRGLLGSRARELATRDWRTAVDELVAHHYAPVTGREITAAAG